MFKALIPWLESGGNLLRLGNAPTMTLAVITAVASGYNPVWIMVTVAIIAWWAYTEANKEKERQKERVSNKLFQENVLGRLNDDQVAITAESRHEVIPERLLTLCLPLRDSRIRLGFM